MSVAYCIHDKVGRLSLTVIVKSVADAKRATEISCDPRHGPYRLERCRMDVARASLDYWRNNATTDKAVDLTINSGWEEL